MKRIVFWVLILWPTWLQAEVPILKENLLTEADHIRFDSTMSVQTTNPDYNTNKDAVTGTIRTSYGLSDLWELGVESSGEAAQTRHVLGKRSYRTNNSNFRSLTFNSSYQLPFLVRSFVFASVTSVERNALPDRRQKGTVNPEEIHQLVYAKSGSFGGSVVLVMEPVVYGFQAFYSWLLPRKIGDNLLDPGEVVQLSGSANFLVTQDISLMWGLGWGYQGEQKLNYQLQDKGSSSANWRLGLEFPFSRDWTFNLSTSSNLTDSNNALISGTLTWAP